MDDISKASDAELEARNLALGAQADAIRAERLALVAELRTRQATRSAEQALRRALGNLPAGSVVVEGGVVTVNVAAATRQEV